MACENKKNRRLRILILGLMFCGLPLVAPRNIDCQGKPFHCVNSTHFIICVDLGRGVSSTVDDVIIPCPVSTICDINNYFECEFPPPPTTLTLPIQPSDVSNESGLGKNKVITKVSWENIDITTNSPMQKTSERSEKYLNNVSITITEEFTTTKAKLEPITDYNQSTTIQQGNINRQYENNSNKKQYQQFTDNSMINESSNLDVAQSDINKDENTNGTKLNSYTIDTRPTPRNGEFKDRKLSSVSTGTENRPLQSSMSPPETTEFYSYTPENRDVITFDSSFTTNSEMPTSDSMSVNTPILSNSRYKSSQIFKSEKETTPYGVTAGTITDRQKTITVEPKVITLSYNSSSSSSQIKNDNPPAGVILESKYQSSNSSNDKDHKSYFDEFSVTVTFRNITPKVSEKYLQSNFTQDTSKPLKSEQLNNTMDKNEPKNIIGDITTVPSIIEVQQEFANQENSDLSVSNSMRTNQLMYTTDKRALTESINSSYIKVSENNKETSKTIQNSQNLQETDKIKKNQSNPPVDYTLKTVQDILPTTDASIFATHKQDRVGDQIKNNITKINIYDEATMSDLNMNYYVTDSYGVNYDQSIKTNFSKHGYTTSEVTHTYGINEVIPTTTTAKNNEIITTISNLSKNYVNDNNNNHNQYESTREISELNSTKSDDLKNENTTKNSKNDFTDDKSFFTTIEPNIDLKTTVLDYKFQNNREFAKKELTTIEPNIQIIKTALNYDLKINKEAATNNLSRTNEESAVMHETEKNITSSFIQREKAMTDLNTKSYAKEDSSSKNQYQSTQTTMSGNDQVTVTTADSNIDIITTTEPNKTSQKNKEETTKNMSKTHEGGVVKHESQKNITMLFIHDGKATNDLKNNNYAKDSNSKNQDQFTHTTNSGNDEVIGTTTELNIGMRTTLPNYNFQNNKENTNNNVLKTHEKSADKQVIQKDITTSFIQAEKAINDLNNTTYAKEDGSGENQYQSTQTINSWNDKVVVTIADLNVDMITTTVPKYHLKINEKETAKNMSKTHEKDIVKHEKPTNLTTLLIDDVKAMSDLNNNSFVKEDSSSTHQFQSTQTKNSGNDETSDSNIKTITITVPNYNSQKNKEETTKNMSKKLETQKNITTLFINDGKATNNLNKNNYAKDSSSKNQYSSTQTTNFGNDEIIVTTTTELNIGMITTALSDHNFQNNKENTNNNMLKKHERGAVMHETQKNITTSFIQGEKATIDFSNKSYADEDSSDKNQYESIQTTKFGNDEVVATTADSNVDIITTTVPNYHLKINKEETTKNMSKTHEKGVVKHETSTNITTLLIDDGKAMTDLNNKSYVKEDISSSHQFPSTQIKNSGNDEVKVTTTDSNIKTITITVPNYNSQTNKEETTKNMSKKLETQKNITTLFINDGKATNNLNNNNDAKDSSSKNQYSFTQTTNFGNDEVIVTTTTELNIGMITTALSDYNFKINKENTNNNVLKSHEKGAVINETQKNITTSFVQGEKVMNDFNNKSYAEKDSSGKNQYQSTQTTNFGNGEVLVTTANLNVDTITTTVSNYHLKINKEEITKNISKTHEKGVVKHETPTNITTLLIDARKAMSDFNNKSYVKEDISSTHQFPSTQTKNSGNDELKNTTTDSNTEMITTTVSSCNSKKNKEETAKNMPNTHEEGVLRQETQKNLPTISIHDREARADLNNKNYIKEESSSKNQYQSTQTINPRKDGVVVTTADSNIDIITKIVPNYDLKKSKKETTKNMSKTHEEGEVKHETPKNITTLLIHDGKAMRDLNNKSYAKDDSSSTNLFQSTQRNSGNDNVENTTTDSNIEMITITIPNHSSQKNKEETTNNMLKNHEQGVVKQGTQKNITTIFIHGGKAVADLNNKNYVMQTTNSGNHEVIVTTTESNITRPIIYGGIAMSNLNNKSFARDKDSKIQYQSTETSNQFNFTINGVLKGELTFNNTTNSFEDDKIMAIEHNTTVTTDVPYFMFTKVDNSGLTTNLNHTDTFVSNYGSNTYVTKSNINTDRSDISDQLTIKTHNNLQMTESTNINGDEMATTGITTNLTFEPTSAPINELKISPETKSSSPASKVEGNISANRNHTFGDENFKKNGKAFSNIDQEISSRTNREAENQMEIFKLRGNRTTNNYNITTIFASEYPSNSSKKYGEDLTATRVPKHADVKVLTTVSEDFNSYTHKPIGITEKNTIPPVINVKDLTTVADNFLRSVTTASYNLKKNLSTTSILKESMSGITYYVNNGRETTSQIMNMRTNTPQYDETKVVESKPLQISFQHSLNIEADTTIPLSESDKVISVLNPAVHTRDVSLLKQNSHTENYQSAEGTVLSLINLTSLSPFTSDNKILNTSVTKTSVDTESATDISNNQPQQLKKTEKVSSNENKPNNVTIKSIQSRDITNSKANTTSIALRINKKFRNESVLNNNQKPDIIPSELSIKVGSNTRLHVSTTEQNIGQIISKHFTEIKQNSSRLLRQTTPIHYAPSTISSLGSDRSTTITKINENTASTTRNTNDMSDATLVTDSIINKRKKKSKAYDMAQETLVKNLHDSDGNIPSMTLNKYKDFSNISNSNMKIKADEPSQKHYLTPSLGMITQLPMNINTKPLTMMEKTEEEYLNNRSKKLNKHFEITSESTKISITDGQNPYKEISVNSNYTTDSEDPKSVSKYHSNSKTRGSSTIKNTTTMAKRIRDVNAKSTNTAPTNVVVIVFDHGRQKQKKVGKSATNYTNTEENPDDNINMESRSHNRHENTDPNDIKVDPMTNTNNADNDNDLQNSPTSKVAVRVNDTDMVICGRYTRGRYPDKNDCRRFYVCVGRNPPIKGICPNNTVYSESRKQCTRNLSHCVRNNKFKCLTEGRFSDLLKNDIYHVCIKNKLGAFVVYKFQCQKGFRLDKKNVKCIKETENSSSSVSSPSESSKRNNKSTTEKTSKVIDKFECQEEGKFADTRDCRTYYVCSKKRNVYRRKKKKCESDERFDRDKKKCVDAESYECDI